MTRDIQVNLVKIKNAKIIVIIKESVLKKEYVNVRGIIPDYIVKKKYVKICVHIMGNVLAQGTAFVMKDIMELIVLRDFVLITAVLMESVTKKQEFVIVKMDGKELVAMKNHVTIIAMEMECAEKENAIATLILLEIPVNFQNVKIIVQITENVMLKMANAFVMMVIAVNLAKIKKRKSNL